MNFSNTKKSNIFLGKFPLLGFKSDTNLITLDASHVIKRVNKKEVDVISKRIVTSNHKSFEYILFYSYSSIEAISYPEEIIDHFKILNVFFKIFKSGSIGIPYCHHYVKNENDNTHSTIPINQIQMELQLILMYLGIVLQMVIIILENYMQFQKSKQATIHQNLKGIQLS